MPDQHNPNDPRWDWLYHDDDDSSADGSSGERAGAGQEPPADHTRMLPQSPRPSPARPESHGGQPGPGPSRAAGPGAGAPPSFGGTYPRPPRATPVGSGPTGSAGGPGPIARGTAAAGPPAAAAGAGAAYAAGPASSGSTATRAIPAGGGSGGGGTGPRYAQPSPPRGGASRPAGAAPPGRPRRKVRWVRIVLAVLGAWLLFLVLVPVYAWTQVAKVDAEPDGPRPDGGPGTTYLLVGSDSRAGLTPAQKHDLGTGSAAGQRTDTIIILHVSSGSGPNVMLSIPRDSYVDIPGHGMNKINAAYAYGGPKLLVRTVEKATGVRIDDYVEIGFTGVVDVVDAVGGITVCPKTSIHDPKAGNLTMKRGCQQVNGHVALDYSRSRAFPLGDITRTQHQREVIAATGSAAASWQTIVFPWRYWRVNMAGADSVTVGDNVGPFAFARFAWAMAHSSGPGTLRCVVPFSSLGTSTSVGSVVTWDTAKANALFRDINDDETSAINCSAQ